MARLALAGMIAPIWFAALVLFQAYVHTDYDQIALPISALAAYPGGWLQNLNFIVFGVLMVAYASALHRGVLPARGGAISLVFLLASGAGLVFAGVFPWRRIGAMFVVSSGHLVAALMSFLGAAFGLLAMSWRMAADPRWRPMAVYTAASGVAMVGLFVALGRLAVPDDAPFHAWAGLGQRIIVVIWFACTIVNAFRLRRLARAGRV